MDDEIAITRIDYNIEGVDVVPVSNPDEVSDTQKIMKAQALRELLGTGYNDQAIRKRYTEALEVENPDELMLPDEVVNAPDPELMIEKEKLQLERDKLEWQMFKGRFEIMKLYGMAVKAIAEAEAVEEGPQIEEYKTQLEAMNNEAQRMHEARMARAPGNQGSGQPAAAAGN